MNNYLLTLKYVGTAYSGSQIQRNAPSIQGALQRALTAVLGARPDVKCCSRTDAGVHAHKFCVSFLCDSALAPARLAMALNMRLPADIRVMRAQTVPPDFHARYDCVSKKYIYRVYNDNVLDPFYVDRAHRFSPHIDEKQLAALAALFVGRHDFGAFCNIRTKTPDDTVRTVSECTVCREGPLVIFTIAADGFLYNMVRIIVGALLNAARGKLGEAEIAALLEDGRRGNLCATAPACGLYLEDVIYKDIEA
ncbi:MAG: tRNA pseudouridine(38-40) synthase TruA [Oscillospiraceae bacterium]|nr:tRNA pseudouridine(38-40) synthase TruA [Oscillospiraceae bacterium]